MESPNTRNQRKPMKKEVSGSIAAAVALIVVYVANEFGLQIDAELQGAIAVLVGAAVAWAKSEL